MDVSPKHIAIICNYELLEDRVGGMDYFFWAFNKSCLDKNIDIDWFFPNTAKHGSYSKLHIIPSGNVTLEKHFINHIKTNTINYSHVITHFVEICTCFFYEVNKITNARIIVADHNPRPIRGYSLKKKIFKKIKGAFFSRYIDVFIGVSEFTKHAMLDDFGHHIKKKVIVILNGLNVEKYIKKSDFKTNNKFIVASHLRKEKGVQDLILAVKNLKNIDFKIDIYGKGYYKNELKKMVVDYSLEDKINFKGSVANLHEIYNKYDYLIHPSHGETFCYSVVESLLSNLPVITTRKEGNVLGLISESNNGFLFEAKDTESLTLLLKSIMKGEKVIVGNSSLLIDNKFLMETMVSNYMKLLNNY